MNKPVRVLDGEARPHEAFWKLVDAASSESGEPEIWFYGYISEYSWWEDDITPALFKSDLKALGNGGPVTIRIHSGGGEVFAASAIRSMIVDYPGKVTTRIEGLCASAATYVAMAGDKVLMHDSAWFMIHDPWSIAIGNVSDLKAEIKVLDSIKAGIIEAYQAKTTLTVEQLDAMMSKETWMTAQQALEYGFIDEVITPSSKGFQSAQNRAVLNSLRDYAHVPPELIADLLEEPAEEEPIEENVPDKSVEELTVESVAEMSEPECIPAETDSVSELDKAAQELRNYLAVFGPKEKV